MARAMVSINVSFDERDYATLERIKRQYAVTFAGLIRRCVLEYAEEVAYKMESERIGRKD